MSKVRDGRKGDYINVTCGNKTGRLYLEKFAKSAKCKARIVDKCIYAEGKDYTPGEFESLGGKGRAKSWKKSIRHQGKPLSEYIKANLIWVQGNVEEMVTLSPVAKQPDHTGRTDTSIEPSSADDTGGSSTTHGGVNMDEIFQGLEQTLMAAVETMVKQACEQMKLLLLEEIAKIQTQVNKLQEQVTQIRSEKATPIPILPEPSSLNESTMGNNPISVQIDSLTAAVNNQQRAMEQQARLLRRQNAVLVGLEETNERELTRKGPMEKTETESGNGNGKRKRKRKTETENGNGKLVMKWKRLHVVSCNNARASYSMHYIALASSVYSLDRTARQDSLKLQPFPCRTS